MTAVIVLVLFVLIVAGILVFMEKERGLKIANIVGAIPLVWSAVTEFLSQFVAAAQQYDLATYVSKDWLLAYFLGLIVLDAIVHAAGKKAT